MELIELVKIAVQQMGTQKEAAQKTGIAYATLQRLLAGGSTLTLDRVHRIASQADGQAKVALDSYLKTGIVPEGLENLEPAVGAGAEQSALRVRLKDDHNRSAPLRLIPLHDVTVSAGGGVNAVEASESIESMGFPEAWLRKKFGDTSGLRIVKVKGDSMSPTVHDDDLVMFDLNRVEPTDGVFVLRMNDQLMVKRVHFPSTRRLLITSDNRDYERFDRLVDLERDETLGLIGRVVWAGKSI